jgi:two-component system, chemotaxis family, response regulator Rcp1
MPSQQPTLGSSRSDPSQMPIKEMAIDILLIEDHPGDARLTQEAFADCARPIRLHHAWDGEEALEFLRREGRHRSDPRPSLILLDLKLPGLSGHETLALIKGDPKLRAIPVIVLTTSDREADILATYRLGANCHLQKPAEWDAFQSLISTMDRFWFTRAKLPQQIDPDTWGRSLVDRRRSSALWMWKDM